MGRLAAFDGMTSDFRQFRHVTILQDYPNFIDLQNRPAYGWEQKKKN
jgi:hypothetical protein